MSDSTYETLRKTVLGEISKRRKADHRTARKHPAKLLGAFIEASLNNLKCSRQQFARELDLDLELAEAILDGFLPASEIDPDLLLDIAAFIRHEPNTLRILLGRAIAPARDEVGDFSDNGTAKA